ncbi:MAG: prepilin-type N-terminal cleavage/methylation domain-containing protein [Verrucomicrobiales bacterium]|nr:prepilin-type N-terminal cleavage/methylation domain-containing protein [Verrucomicrobiales bacterium]
MRTVSIKSGKGFTLIEILIVIAIIGALLSMSFPAIKRMKEKAVMVTQMTNLRNITLATLRWSADNGQSLPSPQYPGGYQDGDPNIPEQWDFAKTGSGLWLDGIVFYATYYEAHNERESTLESGDTVEGVDGENGAHLKGTFFESIQSVKKNPLEQDWHKHSYAMNKSLQYNPLYSASSSPELTNKNLARITYRSKALLFIENEESNVIGFGDQAEIAATAEARWSSGKALASFLDGSAGMLSPKELPIDPRSVDDESARFWSGVDADQLCGT